jgi:streptogramin lyase
MTLHNRIRMLATTAVDFGLAAAERAELRDHLGTCAACRMYVDRLRGDAALLERMTTAGVASTGGGGTSPIVRDRVLAAAARRSHAAPAARTVLQLAVMLLVAMLVLGMTAVVYVGSRQQLKAVDTVPDPASTTAGTVTGAFDTAGRLPPEPDYCRISSGDHRTPDCRIGLASGAGSIWETAGQGVVRVTPSTGTVTAAVPLDSDPRDLVFLDGSLFAATWAGTIERIDPGTNAVAASIRVSDQPLAAMTSASDGSLWVTVRGTGEVVRVDPGLGKVVARISVGGEPYDVAVTGGSAWVSDRTHDRVTRIDAVTNLVTDTVHLLNLEPRDVEATSAGVWVIGSGEMALIDPATGATLKRLPAPRGNLGSGPSSLLVAGMADAGLQRVDPATGEVLGRTSLEGTADLPDIEAAVLEADGRIWIASYGSPTLLRVEPAR